MTPWVMGVFFVCVSSKKYVFGVEQAWKFIDLHRSSAASEEAEQDN